MKLNKPKAAGLLILTAVLWSFGGLLIKSIQWNPLAIAGVRSAIATILLFSLVRRVKFHWTRYLIGGAVSYAATVGLFVVATKLTAAANAILLQYTAPIYVALFGPWFLGERARTRDWLTIAAVLGGMTLFFVEKLSLLSYWGNICGIGSGLGFAWMTLFLRRQKEGSPIESVLLGNLLTAVVCVPFYLHSWPDAVSWGWLLVLGVFQLGLSYCLYSAAIKHVSAMEASLIPALEPVLNPMWVMIALGEKPGVWTILGGIIILGAITMRGIAEVFQNTGGSDTHPA